VPGRAVTRNHVLIGCLGPAQNDEAAAREHTALQDLSVVPRQASEGVARVERVMLQTLDANTQRAVVVIGEYRCPKPGDKFSSLFGQKGVAAQLEDVWNMPFRQDGSVPGFVMGHCGWVTRKTMNQMMAGTAGLVAAHSGRAVDLTAFGKTRIEDLRGFLRRVGKRDIVTEMYSGARGRKLEQKVMMGIIAMGRLKQQMQDKAAYRTRGPPNPVTMQPPQGRNRNGGMKIGRMAVDGILAHGAEGLLRHDRFYHNSDGVNLVVCTRCGIPADPNASTVLRKTGARKEAICRGCNTSAHLANVRSFYSWVKLMAMMRAAGMAPRMQIDAGGTADEAATAAPHVAGDAYVKRGEGTALLRDTFAAGGTLPPPSRDDVMAVPEDPEDPVALKRARVETAMQSQMPSPPRLEPWMPAPSGAGRAGRAGGWSGGASRWGPEPAPATEAAHGGDADVDLDDLALDLETAAAGMYHPDDGAGMRDVLT